MSDLWTEASRDIEAEGSARRLVAARLETAPILPFLTAAKSPADFDQRVALAEDRLIEATGGDQLLAAQVVAQVRAEITFPEPVTKRSFRVEADTAGGGYYLVDEATGQDVGQYPDQAAAEQAASGSPELEVSHTPTGNPDTPGLSQGGPDASSVGSDGTPGPDDSSDPAAAAPASAEGLTPPEAPSGTGDAGTDDTSDSDDAQFPASKTSSKEAGWGDPKPGGWNTPAPKVPTGSKTCPTCNGGRLTAHPAEGGWGGSKVSNCSTCGGTGTLSTYSALGYKVALVEGEDPLLPLLQLLDQGQGQAEQPSYHEDSQGGLGAPQGHANGEVGTSNPEGDFMSAPDAKPPYQASKGGGNPFAKQAGWVATHEQGHDSPRNAPSGTYYNGKVSIPKGLQPHIEEGEHLPRYVADTLHKHETRKGAVAGPFKVGETHTEEDRVYAGRHHPAADSAGYARVQMPATVLGVHTENNGLTTHHNALVRKADGELDHRRSTESTAPAWDDFKNTIKPERGSAGAEFGLR